MEVSYRKLRMLLAQRDLKNADLATMAELSPNSMTKLNNDRFVSMDVLVRICRALRCDVGDILQIHIEREETR